MIRFVSRNIAGGIRSTSIVRLDISGRCVANHAKGVGVILVTNYEFKYIRRWSCGEAHNYSLIKIDHTSPQTTPMFQWC